MLTEHVANQSDLGFMHSCILYGARKGHYAFNADNPEVVQRMKSETQEVISNGKLADGRHATASIFTLGNSRVGMVIICEAAPYAMASEIYALSVVKLYQHRGYGGRILDNVLEQHLYHDVYSRCLPASAAMKKLLVGKGFVFYTREGDFETYVKDGIDCNAAATTMFSGY
jgi:hypothetical protein